MGVFGEASGGSHELVQDLKGELAVIVGQVRRILSTTAVRARADCLIRRVGSVGPGGAAACKRDAVRKQCGGRRDGSRKE